MFIEPGSPWKNWYIESFNGKLRDESLDGEIFYTLKEVQVFIERWRRHYSRDCWTWGAPLGDGFDVVRCGRPARAHGAMAPAG